MENFLGLIPRPLSCVVEDSFVIVKKIGLAVPFSFLEMASVCSNQLNSIDVFTAVLENINENFEGFVFSLEINPNFDNIESYELTISSDKGKILACDNAGLFYGLQTLRQLIMTAEKIDDKIKLPCCIIKDKPAYEWRGVMLDTCRHFFSIEFIKKIIDNAALHKMNRFHWHLTDDQGWRFYVPEFPLLSEIGGFRKNFRADWVGKTGGYYTDQEIADIVEYARLRNVVVVPEVESPGHSSAILASYPGLGCTGGPYQVEQRFGVFDDVLCAGNDKIFELYEAVFDTVCRLFPGPYVHIGGDECPRTNWKSCPKCQSRLKNEHLQSEDELQSWLTVKFASMLEKRGKIPIGWDEVLDGTERLGLPKSMVVQSWRGIEGGIKASNLNHKVIMSPQTQGCYLDYKNYDSDMEPGWIGCATVEKSYGFSPVPSGSNIKTEFVLGGQCNLWTEMIYAPRIAEYMLFPRLCAISECLWLTESEKDFDCFSKRLECHKLRLQKQNIVYYPGELK